MNKSVIVRLAALLLVLLLCGCAAEPQPQKEGYTPQEIFSNYVNSVVHIETSDGGGTGFFIEENVLVTNNHVIHGASWIRFRMYDGSEHDVTCIISVSENPDLALLQTEVSGTPLRLNTHGISEGEPVYALGAPMGIYPCISDGIVMKSSHIDNGVDFFLSNFHSIGGNSGGPVLNSYGELMGIVVGGYVDGANTIDTVINAGHLEGLDRTAPISVNTREQHIAGMNRPEEEKYELADISSAQPGQIVSFGSYEQDNDPDNGAEEIFWRVEERQGDRLVLMSLYCLDVVPYALEWEDTTWETSNARRFLNDEFFPAAFSAQEQQRILLTDVINSDNPLHGTPGGNDTQDMVYLPSLEEVMRSYGIDNAEETFYDQLYAPASKYVMDKGVWLEIPDSNRCWWWLRSPGGNPQNAAEVGSAGYLSFNGTEVICPERALRPMIQIDAA